MIACYNNRIFELLEIVILLAYQIYHNYQPNNVTAAIETHNVIRLAVHKPSIANLSQVTMETQSM